jgi:hypothetical protein
MKDYDGPTQLLYSLPRLVNLELLKSDYDSSTQSRLLLSRRNLSNVQLRPPALEYDH